MKKLILLAIAASALFSSCQKTSNPMPNASLSKKTLAPSAKVVTPGVDIYIAGLNDTLKPIYWLNGVGNILPNTLGSAGEVNAIAVSGSDVYFAGDDVNLGRACYWKNGVETLLTTPNTADPLQRSHAYGIAVTGSDVYIVGIYFAPSNVISAVVWKNGVPRNLAYNHENSSAHGIFIDGSDVYICGDTRINGMSHALYWKNNIFHLFAGTSAVSFARAVTVDKNHNFYIAGYYDTSFCYWKDGNLRPLSGGAVAVPVTLPDETKIAQCIAVNDGQTVYVGGMNPTGGACYWIDGHLVNFPSGNLSGPAHPVLGIAVNGGDVYAPGYVSQQNGDGSQTTSTGYFKNNTFIPLSPDGSGNAIVLVPH